MDDTDKKLLENAAKAAGEEFVNLLSHGRWNPLVDDAHALRLAVRLRMTVYPAEKTSSGVWVNVCIGYGTGDVEIFEKVQGDSLIATRRAIVRAAASIAK